MIPLILAMAPPPQRQVQGMPDLAVRLAFMPGQREVVLGPAPQRDFVMSVIHSRDFRGTHDGKGIAPPVWDEYPLGSVRWSVTDGTHFDQPCRVIRMQGMSQSQLQFKRPKQTVNLQNDATTVWYVSLDGRILRQHETRSGFIGQKVASCTYGDDHITVQMEERGRREVTTVHPADMAKLHLQFRPMMVGGKVVLEEKEYLVYDPFTGGFERRTAKLGPLFTGEWLQTKFKGRTFDLTTPSQATRAYISDEGDLIKVDLPKDDYFILQTLPPGKQRA